MMNSFATLGEFLIVWVAILIISAVNNNWLWLLSIPIFYIFVSTSEYSDYRFEILDIVNQSVFTLWHFVMRGLLVSLQSSNEIHIPSYNRDNKHSYYINYKQGWLFFYDD